MIQKFVSAIAVLALVQVALCEAIRVPAEQATIQSAINVAQDGDSILVDPGTYLEDLDFLGRNVRIIGLGGDSLNQLVGRIRLHSQEEDGTTLCGFAIARPVNIPWYEFLISVLDTSFVKISECRILNYEYSSLVYDSRIEFERCVFYTDNISFFREAVTSVNSSLKIYDCIFHNIKTEAAIIATWGYDDGGVAELTDCVFFGIGGETYENSELLDANNNASFLVDDCIFVGNAHSKLCRTELIQLDCCVSSDNAWDETYTYDGLLQDFNPFICQQDTLTYALNDTSPCLPENRPPDECGIIGPLTQGCALPIPRIENPVPGLQDAPWPTIYGVLGATLASESGIDGSSVECRVDGNGDGDYLDGGIEDWSSVAGLEDAPMIEVRMPVSFPRSGIYAWELRGRELSQGWRVYSGTDSRQGIVDDWTVTVQHQPRTWRLGQDVASLLAARDSLQDGDTLFIPPGSWEAGVAFGAKNVALVGLGLPEECILQAPVGDGPVLRFSGSPDPGSCWLENLTLQGGNGDVLGDSTLVFARHCRLVDGGFDIRDMSWVVPGRPPGQLDARHCFARGGFKAHGGMVLYDCVREGDVVQEVTVLQNRQEEDAERMEPGVVWVSHCRFENNHASGGAYSTFAGLHTVGDGLVSQCVFASNHSSVYSQTTNAEVSCTGFYAFGDVDVVGNLFLWNSNSASDGNFGNYSDARYAAACTDGRFLGNTVVRCGSYDELDFYDVPNETVRSPVQRDNIFAWNWGTPPACDSSSCNLFWANQDLEGNLQDWGNCGMEGGGQVWADPLFCDPEQRDYRLLPGSPAWTPNHQDTAPGCGLLGAYGLCAPQVGPIEIRSLRLVQAPLRARLEIAGATPGLTLHIHEADGLDGPWRELRTLVAADSLLEVELPLGAVQPERRLYRATQDEPGEVRVGSYVWSDFARTPLPEPPLITELERLRRLGLPWKPKVE